jgi:hypothetical protein
VTGKHTPVSRGLSMPAMPGLLGLEPKGRFQNLEFSKGNTSVLAQARGAPMGRVLNEILLFSCMAAFVTGVVIAAASLFG